MCMVLYSSMVRHEYPQRRFRVSQSSTSHASNDKSGLLDDTKPTRLHSWNIHREDNENYSRTRALNR